MASTAQQMINEAFRLGGIISAGGSPSTNMSNNALVTLNDMLNNWAASSVMTTALVRESASIAASAASYVIGASQTINSAKPLRIISAHVQDSSGIDTPLKIITREQFDLIADKDIEGTPDRLFYDPGIPQQATQVGTIYLFPEPSAAMTLYLESEKLFTEFATLATTSTFLPPYDLAIKYNLAILLAPQFPPVNVGAEVYKTAKDAYDTLVSLNARDVRAEIDFRRGGRADIRRGF